jgi:hypothetical protein
MARKAEYRLEQSRYNEFRHSESVLWREREGVKVFMLIYVDIILVLTAPTKTAQDVPAEIAKLYLYNKGSWQGGLFSRHQV